MYFNVGKEIRQHVASPLVAAQHLGEDAGDPGQRRCDGLADRGGQPALIQYRRIEYTIV